MLTLFAPPTSSTLANLFQNVSFMAFLKSDLSYCSEPFTLAVKKKKLKKSTGLVKKKNEISCPNL